MVESTHLMATDMATMVMYSWDSVSKLYFKNE